MSKIIQMVKTSDDNALFIIDFNEETEELTFRTTRKPEHLQKEKIQLVNGMVHTHLYFFHISFLQKFINENKSE